MHNRRSISLLAFLAVSTLPFLAVSLGACAGDVLCCNEFKAGATISADIGGSAQSQVAVQAVADFAGIANAAITDLASACRSIAEDLDADAGKRAAIEADANKAAPDDAQKIRMERYCQLAIESIASAKAAANVKVTITAQPPKCELSASAKANCQAKCDVSGKCEASASLKCEGGKLEVSCDATCRPEVEGGRVGCEGSCKGTCEGSCTAQGGVACEGKCEGTCEGTGGAGTSGVDAQGNCKGTCKGTCSVVKPGAACEGGCKGSCQGNCELTAPNVKIKCDGRCDGKLEPLKCDGKLEGGCNVDAKCDASCDASLQAKAECSPPAIVVDIQGNASGDAALAAIAKLKATFEANMGMVFSMKSRLEGMLKVAGTIAGSADAVVDIKAVCIPQVAVAAAKAVKDVGASADLSLKLVTSATQ